MKKYNLFKILFFKMEFFLIIDFIKNVVSFKKFDEDIFVKKR